jgi:hypothetical protein
MAHRILNITVNKEYPYRFNEQVQRQQPGQAFKESLGSHNFRR